ncbi:Uncharacterized protein DAT39_005114, partial [Clarias magur]
CLKPKLPKCASEIELGNWSSPDLRGTKKKLWQPYPPHVALKSLNRTAQEDHRAPALPVEMTG